jgi:hypothetical protein
MTRKVLSLLLFSLTVLNFSLYSQSNVPPHRTCGTVTPPEEYETWFSQKVAEFVANQQLNRVELVNYTIPVIIHIIHSGTAEGSGANISTAQAQ